MPIAHTRNRYQEGSLVRVSRAKGPDVWVYRWREPTSATEEDGNGICCVRLRTILDASRARLHGFI